MRDFFLLSKALFKNTYSLKKNRGKTIALAALLFLSISPILVMAYFLCLDTFQNSNLGLMTLQALLFLANMIIFWTALFVFPSSFYFSNDVPQLLTLPIPSRTIILAKTFMAYVSSLLISVLFLIPVWIAFVQAGVNGIGAVFFIFQIFLNFLPVLFVIGILTVLVMRFIPFFKNKDRFMLVLGILSIGLAVIVGVASQSLSGDAIEIVQEMLSKNPQLFSNALKIFFQIPSVSESIYFGSWSAFLISLLISFAFGLVFVVLAEKMYLPVALTIGSSGQKRVKEKKIKASDPFMSYLGVQFKTLLRSPTYFSNLVLGSFVGPIMMVAIFLINPEIRQSLPMLKSIDLSAFFNLWTGLFLAGGISGFFLGSMNGICATTFSREGRNIDFIKIIPLSMSKQIDARLIVGLFFSMISALLMLIAFHYIFSYAWYYDLAYIGGALLSSILVNLISILIDGIHPKLDWEDETGAVKQNFNVMGELFVSWLILGLFVLLYFVSPSLDIFALLALIVTIVLVGIFYKFVPKVVLKHLMNV